MVFEPPSWVLPLPEVPDSITIEEFFTSEQYGRVPFAQSKNPYTCGITGRTYTAKEVVARTDHLARALNKTLGFDPNDGTEWDRVACLYSLNTIDYIPFCHAIHRLSGIVTPASAAYNAQELEHQLRTSSAKALFTCMALLPSAIEAASKVGLPKDRIFLLSLPDTANDSAYTTVDDLIKQGSSLPELKPLSFLKGQGARQAAFLSYSSGTSGLPKAVMISHYNVIANVLQSSVFDIPARKELGVKTQTCLGVLPFSHIYGLSLVAHVAQYRGDQIVVLPRFDINTFLNAIQRFRIEFMAVVPPMLINMISNPDLCGKYDLSSIRYVFSGAAPLGEETIASVQKSYPKWHIGQGYGMTEASPVVVQTSELDRLVGSSGSLVPNCRGKVIDADGNEVTEYEKRGELLVQSPSIVLGYLNNEKANAETFVYHEDGRWLKTGDEVLFRQSKQGHDHVFIVDRIKELIKVKGHQVAPAELEAHLLSHDYVSDCAVIPIPDDRAGEVPKAFVVKAAPASGKSDEDVIRAICAHVEEHKARYKWLKGGVELIEAVPKSPSGKILRRLLRDKEKQARQAKGAKL